MYNGRKTVAVIFLVVIFPARIHGCGINKGESSKQLAKPGAAGKR